MKKPLEVGEKMVFVLILCALTCIGLTLLCGALSALFYFKSSAAALQAVGIEFQNLRPLHTTFASAWIFLGGVTCVYKFMFDTFGPPTKADRIRFQWQMVSWGIAGLGILITVSLGIKSGREYIGFAPVFSILIVAGWVAFAWTFFSKVAGQFWRRPVYVYMWATGILYFLYTFIEGHAYLIPAVGRYPIVDLQIQWKSCGSLVASFNLLVYGTLLYLAELISNDRSYAHSTKAFALMGIGILNSFTNFAHHTYHLPQSDVVQWIAFVVSMLEIMILASVFTDVKRSLEKGRPTDQFIPAVRFLTLAKYWTLAMLALAIAISIPPLNTLIHGTHVVMAHAMGAEIGIDSFVLFGLIAYVIGETFTRCWRTQARLTHERVEKAISNMNLALIGLVAWLVMSGTITGLHRASSSQPPRWLTVITPVIIVGVGGLLTFFLVQILGLWMPVLIRPSRRRIMEQDEIPG
jgi:nitric oxide reductase subunit B